MEKAISKGGTTTKAAAAASRPVMREPGPPSPEQYKSDREAPIAAPTKQRQTGSPHPARWRKSGNAMVERPGKARASHAGCSAPTGAPPACGWWARHTDHGWPRLAIPRRAVRATPSGRRARNGRQILKKVVGYRNRRGCKQWRPDLQQRHFHGICGRFDSALLRHHAFGPLKRAAIHLAGDARGQAVRA